MRRAAVSRANAIFAATAPFIVLSIVDGIYREFFRHSPIWFWSFDLFKFLVLPVASLLWLARASLVGPAQYGLTANPKYYSLVRYAGLVACVVAALYLISFEVVGSFAWKLFGQPEPDFFYKDMAPSGAFRLPVVLYLAITAGLFEEIFFRALPLLYLQELGLKSNSLMKYVIGTSVLFGAIHWENGASEVMATFAYGLLASVLYLRLRDLWPLVVAHVSIDILEFW